MNEPFLKALPILKQIESHGYEAYFVGGSIRDFLLKRDIADVDIATSANPYEIKRIFNQTVDVGIEHGTVLVLYNNEGYEITTFRSESGYTDYRHPEKVEFIRSLKRDLERRDFTMNAIAMDQHGELQDPFNGKRDIEEKVIRTVGDAKTRFKEDALRMMRAVRFVSQLEFSIEPETERAFNDNAKLLRYIAVERITNEFIKLLKGSAKRKALSILLQSNLVEYIPGGHETKISLSECIKFDINSLTEHQIWLMILYFYSGDVKEYLKKWRLPNQKIKYLLTCLNALKDREKQEWNLVSLYQLPLEMAIDIEMVIRIIFSRDVEDVKKELMNLYSRMPIKCRDELAVSGRDILDWFDRPGGPWVKKLLNKIEEGVLLRQIENDKDAIKRWIDHYAITNENEIN